METRHHTPRALSSRDDIANAFTGERARSRRGGPDFIELHLGDLVRAGQHRITERRPAKGIPEGEIKACPGARQDRRAAGDVGTERGATAASADRLLGQSSPGGLRLIHCRERRSATLNTDLSGSAGRNTRLW
jgi:hypothetical protein